MFKDSNLLDDMARMASSATGAAFDFKREIEGVVAAQLEKMMGKMNMVTREEFDAVRDIARKARAENESLREELEALKADIKTASPAKKPAAKKPAPKTKK